MSDEAKKISVNTGVSIGLIIALAGPIAALWMQVVELKHQMRNQLRYSATTWKVSDQERWILKCKELNPELNLKFPDPREMVRDWNKVPE